MSKNLLKGYLTQTQDQEKRIIEVNHWQPPRPKAAPAPARPAGQEAEEADGLEGLFGEEGFVEGLPVAGRLTAEEAQAGADDGAAGTADAESLLSLAREEAESLLAQAREEAAALTAQAMADATALRKAAKDEGFQQGWSQALSQAREQEEALEIRAKELEEEYRQRHERLEPALVAAITGIYEQVFKVDLASYKEVLLYLLSQTLRKADGARRIFVHISPEDFSYVQMQKKQLPGAGQQVEIVEDLLLGKGQCMIETEGGIFDCGLGTQLEELSRKLQLLSYEPGPDEGME